MVALSVMNNVEIDVLGTGVLQPGYGQYKIDAPTLTWKEDRWLIGWAPWIGYGRTSMLESHLLLSHQGLTVFLRGPHKESDGQMYDLTGAEFFPPGCGRLVKAGEVIGMQFLVSNTGYPTTPCGGQ